MYINKIEKDNLLNGPGIRLIIWFQGCSHKCEDCHNPETWGFSEKDNIADNIQDIIDELNNDHYKGITLTGGCPFCQNIEELGRFIDTIKKHCPGKDIWCWAGELYEELISYDMSYKVIKNIDVLVDGPFIKSLLEITKYKGSSNQRVIDVQQSLAQQKIILYELGW